MLINRESVSRQMHFKHLWRKSEYALKKNPEKGIYIDTYARLLYSLGDLENALIWQEKAVKLDPSNKTYKDTLNYYLAIKKLRNEQQDKLK